MSKESREEKREITVNELLIRASQLRDYLSLLSTQIENYTAQATELQLILNTIDSLPESEASVLMVLDRLNTVFIPAKIASNWSNELIVNIGRNYYIKTNKEKARELVSKRLDLVRRILDDLRRRYQTALNEYNAIQQVLASVYTQISTRQELGKQ